MRLFYCSSKNKFIFRETLQTDLFCKDLNAMLPVLSNTQLFQAISLQEHTVGHHRNILNVHALLEKGHSK